MIRFAETLSPRRAGSLLLVLVGLVAFVAGAFAAAKPRVDNPHGKFREDCDLCHDPRAWEQIKVSPKFDHSKYGFPLTGAHATSDCMSCHTTLEFTQSKTKCASCHTDPHRGEMGTECARCHGARSFTDRGPMVRAHQMTRFPLTGSHAALDCESCHQPSAQGRLQYVNTSLDCYGCHRAQYATAPDHVSGHFSTQCQTCHSPVRWNDANGFDHAAAGFPLTGGHSLASRKCDDCHHGDYRHTAPDCYACHATSTPGYSTAQPPHDPAAFPTNTPACIGCHVQANATHVSWEGASTFDHAAAGFPLTGQHSSNVRQCQDCHAATGYATGATSPECISCHQNSTPGYATAQPPHNTTYFPTAKAQCLSCHAGASSFTSWANGTYTHATMPLTNAHANRACEDCHHGNYTTVAYSCYGCHQPAYAAATPVKHTPANFPTSNASCLGCHNTSVFSPSTWPANHSTTTFAAQYSGAHPTAACTDCHNAATWNVQGTGTNCYGCHQPDYAGATNPTHDPANFPTAGCTCHSLSAWQPASAHDHAAAGFPLTGQHSTSVRLCADCHSASGFGAGATSQECISCHQNSTPGYATAQPPHNTTYFPTAKAQCLSCHAGASSFTSWANGTYTHATMPLTNAHANRACEDCHHGNYTTVAYSCYGCHQPAYAAATPVKHTPANFPTSNASCLGCHNTSVFSPSTWPANHSTTTFAAQYSGAHPTAACTDCHNAATWNVQGTGTNCYGCHQPDYAGATDPVHDTANFPVAGCTCHSLAAWSPANGHDHTAAGFPLNGQHSTTARACSDCHATSGYAPGATSKDCYSCHATSNPGYSTAQPPHNTTYFPTATANCTGCHATAASALTSWSGGTYTHATMPMTNAHANRACEDCHAGNYTTVAYSCYGCHQAAYAASSPVKHTPANFPTSNASCLGCHNTSVFSPATWPSNHSTTSFAAQYSGAHLALACTDCHNAATWNVQGTGTNCYGCHATDYANTTNPHHDTTNYPVAGCICHSLNAWSPATGFDHTAAGFPLTGEHALTVRQCADCHAASGYGAGATSPDCYSCHANANMGVRGYNDNLVVKHSTPNFPTTTPACIACHTAANASHLTWAGGTFSNHAGVTTNFALTGNHGGMDCSDCHTAATTDLKQYTCSVSCHSGDRDFTQHENKSCAGTNFNTARTDPQIKACYPCHPRGTKSSPC